MIVYRYLELEYLQRFRNEGKIYVSTFKKVKSHPNEQLRDETEGEFEVEMTPRSKPESHSSDTMNQISSIHFAQVLSENVFTVMPNSSATFKQKLEDAYIFCTSSVNSSELKEKWNCNAVFRITDIFSFAEIMYEELSNEKNNGNVVGYIVDKVTYGFKRRRLTPKNKDDVISRLTYDVCLRKPMEFRREKEWRIVFLAIKTDLVKPHEITCPKLLTFCQF